MSALQPDAEPRPALALVRRVRSLRDHGPDATPQFNTDFSPDQLRDPQGRWTTGGEREPVSSAGGHAPGGEAPSRGPTTRRQGPHAPDGTPITLAAAPETGGDLDPKSTPENADQARPQSIFKGPWSEEPLGEPARVKPPTSARSNPSSEKSATPSPFEQPSTGNLKRATQSMLERAAREAGCPGVEEWKTDVLKLNSTSDSLVDREGNAHSIPRKGSGEARPLYIKVPE